MTVFLLKQTFLMLYELLQILVLSLIPGCLSYFLDYCFGFPQGEQTNTKAIFFSLSLYFAMRRVEMMGKMNQVVLTFKDLLNSDDFETRKSGKDQMKLTIFTIGREHFGWEQMFGMCKYCTNVHLSLFAATAIYYSVDFKFVQPGLLFMLIPIFSHTFLRKI